MSYIFKKQLVDVTALQAKYNQQGKTYSKPYLSETNSEKYITLQETDNTRVGADAQAHANLQSNGYSDAWHYQGDDKQVIQSWDESVSCYHAGDGTSNNGLGSKTSVAYGWTKN